MAERVFALPDLGEGLEEAVVSAWLVAEDDTVALNQPFVEIETAKATVEVPAPWPGHVVALHAAAGSVTTWLGDWSRRRGGSGPARQLRRQQRRRGEPLQNLSPVGLAYPCTALAHRAVLPG